jgi:hypothetical protein
VNKPQAVYFGSSFGLGLGLNDEETFTAQVNRQLGPIIYNASQIFDTFLSADRFTLMARETGMEHGWIVVEILNRGSFKYTPPSRSRLKDDYRAIHDELLRSMVPIVSVRRRIINPYALTRESSLLNMRLEDGRILPNPFHDLYSEEQLITGRKVLMFSDDKQFSQRPDSPNITADALLLLRDELERRGYRLAVILLPNSYSVYYPLLRNHETPDASVQYMLDLSLRLSAGGVEALNLLPEMRAAARSELNRDRMIYFSDDAHWNALGCRIAAHAAAEWLQPLLDHAF